MNDVENTPRGISTDTGSRTVSPRLVDATLRDGRVSIGGETRSASLTVKTHSAGAARRE